MNNLHCSGVKKCCDNIYTMDHRVSYLQKYREENRAYFVERAKEASARNREKYGKQARCSTCRFFNGEPLQWITIEKKALTVSFD